MAKLVAIRAVKVAVVVFIPCMAALAVFTAGGGWAGASPTSPNMRTLLKVLTPVAVAVATPAIPVSRWFVGPDQLQAAAVLAVGSLIWGTLIAAMWTVVEWLRSRRASGRSGTMQA